MNTATIVESLAGTGKLYVSLQAREISGHLHIQVVAPDSEGANRFYGLSTDVDVPSEILQHFIAATGAVDLLASQRHTGKMYLPMQATTIDYNGQVHLQAPDGHLNRRYGLAFDVDAPELWSFINNLLVKTEESNKNRLTVNADDWSEIVIYVDENNKVNLYDDRVKITTRISTSN